MADEVVGWLMGWVCGWLAKLDETQTPVYQVVMLDCFKMSDIDFGTNLLCVDGSQK